MDVSAESASCPDSTLIDSTFLQIFVVVQVIERPTDIDHYASCIKSGSFMFLRSSRLGQGLTEYSLIIALVITVSIIGLLSLGGGVKGVGTDFGHSLKLRHTNPLQTAHTTSGVSTAQSYTIYDSLSPIPLDPNNLIHPIRSNNISHLVQTIGANGATDFLASTISAYVQQLLNHGELTEAQAHILQQLANEGHRLAKAQEAMSAISTPHPTNFTFEGQQYSTEEVLGNLTWHEYDSTSGSKFQQEISTVLVTNPKTQDSLAQRFRDLYQQALNSGALDDPSVKTKISYMAVEIANLTKFSALYTGLHSQPNSGAEAIADRFGYMMSIPSQDSSEVQEYLQNDPPPSAASNEAYDISHRNSGVICREGEGRDNGRSCSRQ